MYDIVEELGYSGRYVLYWKQYGRRFSIKHLRTYSDVIDMLAAMTKNRQVNVYLEEEVTEVVRTEIEDATRDVTEEAIYDVEVDDICSEEDSDYVVYDVEDDASGSEDCGSCFEDSESGGSDHELYAHDVNVNNDFKMGLNNDLLGDCHIRVNDDNVNEGEELHSASEFDSGGQKKKVNFPEFNIENKNVTYKWLAKSYLEKYRDDPTYSSRQLKKDVIMIIKVSANKCLRARNLALEMVMGSHKDQYSMIYNYLGGTYDL
ncbi:hypothetical protein V6N13_088573 [Hibiscus sabdariffa]